jgi:hypothetical protein
MKYTEKNKPQYFEKDNRKKDEITFLVVRYFYRQLDINHAKHSENFSFYHTL